MEQNRIPRNNHTYIVNPFTAKQTRIRNRKRKALEKLDSYMQKIETGLLSYNIHKN